MVTDLAELRVGTADIDTALDRDWRHRFDDVDVVRVPNPPARAWPELLANGFSVKPLWVTWGAALQRSERDFVSRLSAKEQRNIRDSQRAADAAGLRIRVNPLSAATLDEFLPVYEAQIAGMANGIPYARRLRDQLLANAATYLTVSAHLADSLVGGCICQLHPGLDLVRVAFAATRPDTRAAMLTRALYLTAAQEGRQRGHHWMSLGSDPSLYGALTRPGLFTFKARLGFVPIPMRCYDPDDDDAVEVAEAVLSLRRLSDPSLSLSYSAAEDLTRRWHWSDPPRWRLQVLSTRAQVDLRPFRAPFVQHCELTLAADSEGSGTAHPVLAPAPDQ